jgi:hypothetical protein
MKANAQHSAGSAVRMTDWSLRAVGAVMLSTALATSGQAASITFSDFDHVGTVPVDYLATVDDSDANWFDVHVRIDPGGNGNYGDIVAVYFDLFEDPPGTNPGYAFGDFATTGDFLNVAFGPITGGAFETNNVQAGNISQVFDVGLAIGATGLGGGTDDYQETKFRVRKLFGLTLDDWTAFGIRTQSIDIFGDGSNNREASGKEVGDFSTSDEPNIIPLPAAAGPGLALLGLAWIGTHRCRPRGA